MCYYTEKLYSYPSSRKAARAFVGFLTIAIFMTFPMETLCLCIKVDPRLYIYDSGGKFFD